jgi:5'-3' exonuclease
MSAPKNTYILREEDGDIINIDRLKEAISDMMNGNVRDFAILTYLLGNDFLSAPLYFSDMYETIELLIGVYRTLNLPLINRNHTLNWDNIKLYLAELVKNEQSLLVKEEERQSRYEEPMSILVSSVHNGVLDYASFRTAWYNKVIGTSDESCITEMCSSYLATLDWIYAYYVYGTKGVNNKWIYPYYYAPLLSDVYRTLISHVTHVMLSPTRLAQPLPSYPILSQLLVVLPPSDVELLPPSLRSLVLPSSDIYDLFPRSFVIDKQGKMEHNYVALIPIPDIDRVIAAVNIVIHKDPHLKRYISGVDYVVRKELRRPTLLVSYVHERRKNYTRDYVKDYAKDVVRK